MNDLFFCCSKIPWPRQHREKACLLRLVVPEGKSSVAGEAGQQGDKAGSWEIFNCKQKQREQAGAGWGYELSHLVPSDASSCKAPSPPVTSACKEPHAQICKVVGNVLPLRPPQCVFLALLPPACVVFYIVAFLGFSITKDPSSWLMQPFIILWANIIIS